MWFKLLIAAFAVSVLLCIFGLELLPSHSGDVGALGGLFVFLWIVGITLVLGILVIISLIRRVLSKRSSNELESGKLKLKP